MRSLVYRIEDSAYLYVICLLSLGIVLKNARMTKKGKSKANVASGSVVETLVITSSNIVQIVAEVCVIFVYLLPFFFIIILELLFCDIGML